MSKPLSKNTKAYEQLLVAIGTLLEEGRKATYRAAHHFLIHTYWQIGQHNCRV